MPCVIPTQVIAKTRERIAAAEAEAAARAPAPGPLGMAAEEEGDAGDIFDVQAKQVVVERDARWDCESVLSLR